MGSSHGSINEPKHGEEMADSICSNCEISYTHEPGDKIRHLCVNCAECDGCGAGVSIWFSAWHDDVMLCDGCNVSFKGGNARLVRIVEVQDV